VQTCRHVGLLFLGTVALTLAGIDTGTSFGGMGASREITIAALRRTNDSARRVRAVHSGRYRPISASWCPTPSSTLGGWCRWPGCFAFVALVIVIVAETGRLPVDNPRHASGVDDGA